MCDASALISLLLDDGTDGAWVHERLRGKELVARALVDFEVSNVIRRQEMAGHVSADVVAQAHGDLLQLPIERWPYELLGLRVWQLRHHLSAYDASYVAVAEIVGAPLLTLDARLARTHGLRCRVEVS
ncbi:MAG: type II toxin-antitoxin system VapC family toxin [Actinomycetota bacterium]|nr:type II toxin-antitoxin system VapC family toxin [Actinomycetota bacterium]